MLLLHEIGDFERQRALECRGLDFFENSFLAEKIIERGSVVRVL